MKKTKILRALILGIGITILSSNVTFAETNQDNKTVDQIIEIAVVDEDLAKKQEEIDHIVFDTNSKEIKEKGFTVVSTGMINKFVEARIEPYNEENAEYLYSILGRDMVNVVDGKEAALLGTDEVSPDVDLSSPSFSATAIDENILNKQRDIDQYVFDQYKDEIAEKGFEVTHTGTFQNYVEIGIMPYNAENTEYLYNIFGRDIIKVVEGRQITTMVGEEEVQEAELYVTTTAVKEEKSNGLTLPLLIVAVCALGGVAILSTRKKANYKR